MPIYNFKCPKCGKEKEVFYHVGPGACVVCGKCGTTMKKIMSVPGKPVIH